LKLTPEKIAQTTYEAPYSTEERRQALRNIAQRRAELETERARIEAELSNLDGVEAGHKAALQLYILN